jgi:hypothetical protein
MRKVLILLTLLVGMALPAMAQNSFFNDHALRYNTGFPAYPASGAVITVCQASGVGLPCTPLAPVCSSATDTVCQSPNPFNADANGNFSFWAGPGQYQVTITGANVSGYTLTVFFPVTFNPTGNITFSGNNIFSGTNTHSGLETFTGGLTANSVTVTGLTPGGCVQAGIGGILITTGSTPCGGGGGSGVNTTGTPVSGNLTVFSGPSSITNGNLIGDVVTFGTLTTTVNSVHGVTYPANPLTNTVPVVTTAGAVSYISIPNCSALAYNSGTFSCATLPSVNGGRSFSVCSTGGSSGATCPTTVTLNFTEPDTNYTVAPACVNPIGYPIILGVTKFFNSVTVAISNGNGNMAVNSTCGELDVVVTGT